MKVLFVCSGNRGLSPIAKNQGDSLSEQGVEVDYFLIQGTGLVGYLRNVTRLRKRLKDQNYDLIHAHYSLSAMVSSLAGGSPLVVSLMGSDVKSSKLFKCLIGVFASIYKWEKIIVKSEDMRQSLGRNDVEVIPNGVNCDRFTELDRIACRKLLNWNEGKKHILFPSDPDRKEKNYELLEHSLKQLNRDDVDVHYLKNIPNEEMNVWYNASDVVVMTSLWEGSPNAIKEAMACGVPIVCTKVGDVEKNISGLQGCYLVDYDVSDVALKIEKALSFEGRTNSRERLSSLELKSVQVAKRLINIYQTIIDESIS